MKITNFERRISQLNHYGKILNFVLELTLRDLCIREYFAQQKYNMKLDSGVGPAPRVR